MLINQHLQKTSKMLSVALQESIILTEVQKLMQKISSKKFKKHMQSCPILRKENNMTDLGIKEQVEIHLEALVVRVDSILT